MSLVVLHDVIKIYKPEHSKLKIAALRGVDLSINQGDFIGIVGPSGSGKSTLLRMISGLEEPSSGTIEFYDQGDLADLSPNQLKSHLSNNIGIINQALNRNVFPDLSVERNVLFPMKVNNKFSRKEKKIRINELLASVGLSEKKHSKPYELSGGQVQRLSIIMALANKPKLVIADEPTSNLDTENAFKIINYFRKINEESGTTFVVVTHDNRLSNLTQKNYKIKDGRVYDIQHQNTEGNK